jgi:hypothetical protein
MDAELRCVAQRFDVLAVRFDAIFYVLAICELLSALAGFIFHAIDSVEYKNTALILEGVAAGIGTLLILVPVDSTRRECRKAYTSAASDPPSAALYKRLASVDVLCFAHPMASCPALTRKFAGPAPTA